MPKTGGETPDDESLSYGLVDNKNRQQRAPTVPDEDFFSLILRLQGGRIEDQRSTMPDGQCKVDDEEGSNLEKNSLPSQSSSQPTKLKLVKTRSKNKSRDDS